MTNSLHIRRLTVFVIKSSLDSTDCSDCLIFQKGTELFAKRHQLPNYVSLPIRIAKMPNVTAAEEVLRSIQYAIKTEKRYVDLTDLE